MTTSSIRDARPLEPGARAIALARASVLVRALARVLSVPATAWPSSCVRVIVADVIDLEPWQIARSWGGGLLVAAACRAGIAAIAGWPPPGEVLVWMVLAVVGFVLVCWPSGCVSAWRHRSIRVVARHSQESS